MLRVAINILATLLLVIVGLAVTVYIASGGQSNKGLFGDEAWTSLHQADGEPDDMGQPLDPQISGITASNPYCYVSDPSRGVCAINWRWIQVSGAPAANINYLTIEIDGRRRANYRGFFDTSIQVQSGMNGEGFKVACGPPGENADNDPVYGFTYSYRLKAEDSANAIATVSSSVRCPGVTVITNLFLPALNIQD